MDFDALSWVPVASFFVGGVTVSFDHSAWGLCIVYAVCASRTMNWTAWGVCTVLFALAMFSGALTHAVRS